MRRGRAISAIAILGVLCVTGAAAAPGRAETFASQKTSTTMGIKYWFQRAAGSAPQRGTAGFQTDGKRLASLSDIEVEVQRIEATLGEPSDTNWPTFGRSNENGTPHIEIDRQYHYITRERGEEYKRLSTSDLNELMYWCAKDMALSKAMKIESEQRHPTDGFRRQLFDVWVKLVAKIDSDWTSKIEAEISDILKDHPFVDER